VDEQGLKRPRGVLVFAIERRVGVTLTPAADAETASATSRSKFLIYWLFIRLK
jgi:hypothetical protein